jgi:site-specific recombinase XerD
MPTAAPVRTHKLHRDHFAFYRAIVQGVEPRAAWERYLQLGDERVDERRVRSAIAAMRGEFAAAATRERRPGTARLVLIDPNSLPEEKLLPTLEEFATERGLEDFSEAEKSEAYAAEFGSPSPRGSRRARLSARQLEALHWLEELMAEAPRQGDGVSAWFTPSLAHRLEAAGLPTIQALVDRVNGVGLRWWAHVPGIAKLKAARIVDWLRKHEGDIGVRIGLHVTTPRTQLHPNDLASVVHASTSVVPFEKFKMPAELDGRAGAFRAPGPNLLGVDNDLAAVEMWLRSKRGGEGKGESATVRSYRKEAERLVLWAILVRKKPLSSLDVGDANTYLSFLQSPPPDWCGARHHQRWSPLWRPLEGPLTAVSLGRSHSILKSLYGFLQSQSYSMGNPFSAVSLPRESGRALGSQRTLSPAQWHALATGLKADQSPAGRRLSRAVNILYATGLRLSELTAATFGDLVSLDLEGVERPQWLLTVLGKGKKVREVPMPMNLVDELRSELRAAGLPDDPSAPRTAVVPLLAAFSEGHEGFGPSGLYKAIKRSFWRVAEGLDPEDAKKVRAASPHWLRHSHASHALNGTNENRPVPVQIVQNNLGHASLGTTSGYLTTERDARVRAMQSFWGESANPVSRSGDLAAKLRDIGLPVP